MRALLIAAFLIATNAAAECDWYCERALTNQANTLEQMRIEAQMRAIQEQSDQFSKEMDADREGFKRYQADLEQWRKNGMPMGQEPKMVDY